VGVQVPADEHSAWQNFLDGLGYQYVDESSNPAYQLFLGAVPAAGSLR
jgi:threonine dehydratase